MVKTLLVVLELNNLIWKKRRLSVKQRVTITWWNFKWNILKQKENTAAEYLNKYVKSPVGTKSVGANNFTYKNDPDDLLTFAQSFFSGKS